MQVGKNAMVMGTIMVMYMAIVTVISTCIMTMITTINTIIRTKLMKTQSMDTVTATMMTRTN